MTEYERERVARLFDDIACAKGGTSEGTATHGDGVPQLAGRVALEKLSLCHEDVLLDVGTGTGGLAVAAARICRQVVGIDVSMKSLEQARKKVEHEGLDNVTFAYGALEEPCAELDLSVYKITKILAVYSLHHLPDPMKKQSLLALTGLLHRPGRMVIGDIMFFGDRDSHRDRFDEAGYDAGDTDFPSHAEYLRDCLEQTGARVQVERVHPIVGVVVADFS